MDALGINIPGLVTQILGFLILFGILYMLLYKPILRMLDQRSVRIRESLEAAQRAQEGAAESQQLIQNQLDEARAEGQQLIAQAREVAERFREDEQSKTRIEIEGERNRAQAAIANERDAAIEDLRREFAGLAISAAERVIERSLDESAHEDLINQVLEQGSQTSRN